MILEAARTLSTASSVNAQLPETAPARLRRRGAGDKAARLMQRGPPRPGGKRGRGYATAALRLLLPEIAKLGLPCVEVTTDPDNIASQRVATACGGTLFERFDKPALHGGGEALRYRIILEN